jgi:hypothetical protein
MKDLYDYLVQERLTPNGLYVLQATHEEFLIPNYLNFKHEQYRLSLSGHLKEHKEPTQLNAVYTITDKGLHVIRKAHELVSKVKAEKKINIPFSDWEEKIEQYNQLFPKGKKQGSSISFRTAPKELFDRFKWFFKEYPEYTWDDIMTATERYLKPYNESSDYTYAQTSKYFIKKEDKNKSVTSTLATMCYNIKEGNDEEINDGYHYFGP